MHKTGFVITVFMVMVFVSAESVWAQLIDWERRHKNKQDTTSQITIPAKPPASASVSGSKGVTSAARAVEGSVVDKIAQLLTSQPSVLTRDERLYDANQDGKLQEKEIKMFFSDVVKAVDKQGEFAATSMLLKVVDKNADGHIDRTEVIHLKSFTR